MRGDETPPPKKNDYCFFLSQEEVESFHSSRVWPVSMLLLCRLECVGRKSFADYKMCVSDSMLWLCLILVCFFYKFSLHFSFPSFVPSVCIYPPLCFCSFSSYSLSEYLLFSLPIIFFLKVFFSPSCFLISSGVLVHTPLLLVSLCCLLLLFFYCQLFYFLLFLFFASFTFSLLSSVVFFHFPSILFSFLFFSWFAFLSHLFLVSFPHTLGPCILCSFPFFPFPRFPISHPAPFL